MYIYMVYGIYGIVYHIPFICVHMYVLVKTQTSDSCDENCSEICREFSLPLNREYTHICLLLHYMSGFTIYILSSALH